MERIKNALSGNNHFSLGDDGENLTFYCSGVGFYIHGVISRQDDYFLVEVEENHLLEESTQLAFKNASYVIGYIEELTAEVVRLKNVISDFAATLMR